MSSEMDVLLPIQRYRKKPVVIEAWQVPVFDDDEGGIDAYLRESTALADWCGGVSHLMTNPGEKAHHDSLVEGPYMMIHTLEGDHAALPSDWIIKGVKGEFYPCKPDIFDVTYDLVSE